MFSNPVHTPSFCKVCNVSFSIANLNICEYIVNVKSSERIFIKKVRKILLFYMIARFNIFSNEKRKPLSFLITCTRWLSNIVLQICSSDKLPMHSIPFTLGNVFCQIPDWFSSASLKSFQAASIPCGVNVNSILHQNNVTPSLQVREPEYITIFFTGYLPLESERMV